MLVKSSKHKLCLCPKPDIKRLTKTGVEFVDGTVVENVDLIVTATGYVFGFPYLEEGVVKVEKNVPDLYRLTFPPNLAHNTLAVIGCFQPIGAVNPPAELQSRWATRVFKVGGLA
jgi:dimethylaniline monooxygenase (N-oxide forming)